MAGNCHKGYVSSDVILKGCGLSSLWFLAYRRDLMLIVEMSIWHIWHVQMWCISVVWGNCQHFTLQIGLSNDVKSPTKELSWETKGSPGGFYFTSVSPDVGDWSSSGQRAVIRTLFIKLFLPLTILSLLPSSLRGFISSLINYRVV